MKQFVMVAGYDYTGGTTFGIFCTRRIDQLIAANPNTDLKFTTLDFKTGQIITRQIKFTNGVKADTSATDSSHVAVTSSHYAGKYFKNGTRDTLSITDVYDKVSEIGTNNPGELIELSIFSHSWKGGVIMVNSFDDRSSTYTGAPKTTPPASMQDLLTSPNKRDPDDKDSRSIDFSAPTMDINKFKAAFHANGYSWLWGCTATDVFRDFIQLLKKSDIYNGTSTPDTASLTIFNQDFLTIIDNYLNIKPAPGKTFVKITFGQARKLLCLSMQNSYSFELAKASNRKVYASFVGSGSVYEPGSTGLMKADPGRTELYKFYKDHLGIQSDPTGRNYAIYEPTLTCP